MPKSTPAAWPACESAPPVRYVVHRQIRFEIRRYRREDDIRTPHERSSRLSSRLCIRAPILQADLAEHRRKRHHQRVLCPTESVSGDDENDYTGNGDCGAFTLAVRRGLSEGRARDRNRDGAISRNELQEFVRAEVLDLTYTRQRPKFSG